VDTLTRRKFLIASGVTAGAALAAGAGAYTLKEILDTAGWQDKTRRRKTARRRHFNARRVQRNWDSSDRVVVSEHDFHALRPREAASGHGVFLHECEPRDAAVLDLEMGCDFRTPGLFHPGVAPRLQIVRCPAVEHFDQIRP